jgi:hypothetical protein
MTRRWSSLLFLCLVAVVRGQTVRIEPADPIDFPAVVDSNSPAYWDDGQLLVYNSLNLPIRSVSEGAGHYSRSRVVFVQGENRWRWVESVWNGADGSIYAWYHSEPLNVCPGRPLTAPEIGEMVSPDGIYFQDLGIILRSGAPPDCATANNYFAGGHGDFTVIPDQSRKYLYFLFSAYDSPATAQGIAIARMAMDYVARPVGRVRKFFNGDWSEPGLGGQLTPVFAARSDWASNAPDAFWGPSIHWNTALQQYVMLMNHVAGDPLWGQEGIYASFSADLANPASWTAPMKLMDASGWYPQVIGDGTGGTDSLAGSSARLYVMGTSQWRITFEPGPMLVQSPDGQPALQTDRADRRPRARTALRRRPG